jgi:hypothetical protein
MRENKERTPPNKIENLPPLTFRFQYASEIELEILHIFVYFVLFLLSVEKKISYSLCLGVYRFLMFWMITVISIILFHL